MSIEHEPGFQFLAENSTDVICRASASATLHYVSPSSFPVLGWKTEEMVGKNLDTFVFAEDASILLATLGHTEPQNPETPPFTLRMAKKDGTLTWMEIKHCVLSDPAETVLVMRDVANRMPLEDRLSAQSLTDSRTGLCTYQAFLKALEREWNRALRESSPLSLVRLDFNDFAHFHGPEGHAKGDGCLSRAAAAVLGSMRLTDIAARYGAEDIAIILPFTDADGGAKVVEKLRSVIEPLRSPNHSQVASSRPVSVGLSTVTARSGGTMRMPEILLLTADHALHKSQYEEARFRRHAVDRGPHPGVRNANLTGTTPQCA